MNCLWIFWVKGRNIWDPWFHLGPRGLIWDPRNLFGIPSMLINIYLLQPSCSLAKFTQKDRQPYTKYIQTDRQIVRVCRHWQCVHVSCGIAMPAWIEGKSSSSFQEYLYLYSFKYTILFFELQWITVVGH